MTSAPDLTAYDWILVNSSAGKDSQAMLDLVVAACDAAGVDRARIVVAHADLGRVEWQGTAELAAEHAAHYGLRFEIMARPQGDLLDHVQSRRMWPSSAARYCTSDHKRGQIAKILTALAGETRAAGIDRPARILNCMGLRAEESPARAKKSPMRRDTRATNGRRIVDEWLPILDWRVADVWARIDQAGTRTHPAYAAGMPRLSCCFCVLASRSALILAAQLEPELAATYRDVEDEIGHTFRPDISIREIIDQAAAKIIRTFDDQPAIDAAIAALNAAKG